MWEDFAEPHGGSLSNPANSTEVADRLEFTSRRDGFEAERDSPRKETDLRLYEDDDGVRCNSISDGMYVLSGWTRGLALQINIRRHLILPSVKRQRGAGRADVDQGR
ncbi:hypothetical protein VZT92_001919 [Zoarces viviparus]|uniref:Uncharacterized protein n=1 Tax=Zoarces viviparus TaxID=48416 RepID=A0AAW1G5Q1_ZOAVI